MSERNSEFSESTSLANPGNIRNTVSHNDVVKDVKDGSSQIIVEDEPPKNSDNGTDNFSFFRIPRRQKLLIIFCFFANYLSSCAYALIAPFYPLEAKSKGLDLTSIGFVFSVYQLVVFVVSPIVGKYMTKIGVKFVYLTGILVAGVSAVLFGILDKCPGGTTFLVMSTLTRSAEAVGFTCFVNVAMTVVSSEFPGHIGSVMAIIKIGNVLGFMSSPALGGVLYAVGGFGLPFYIIGFVLIIGGISTYVLLPDLQDVKMHTNKHSIFKLVTIPMVIFPMFSVVLDITGFSVFEVTIVTHLEPFHLSAPEVGAFFLIASAMYVIGMPLWAYLTDVKDVQAPVILFGHVMFIVSFMLMGPSPLLPFLPFKLWVIYIGWCLHSFIGGCLTATPVKCMMQGAYELKFERDTNTCAMISGLYNAAYAFGGFAGPLLGGAVVQKYGFPYGYTIIAFMSLIVMIPLMGMFLFRYVTRKSGRN